MLEFLAMRCSLGQRRGWRGGVVLVEMLSRVEYGTDLNDLKRVVVIDNCVELNSAVNGRMELKKARMQNKPQNGLVQSAESGKE